MLESINFMRLQLFDMNGWIHIGCSCCDHARDNQFLSYILELISGMMIKRQRPVSSLVSNRFDETNFS
jgi:hypothetical protein